MGQISSEVPCFISKGGPCMKQVPVIKGLKFERNMFKNLRKYNEQKIQWFVVEYGNDFTRETGVFWRGGAGVCTPEFFKSVGFTSKTDENFQCLVFFPIQPVQRTADLKSTNLENLFLYVWNLSV